jgi:hypothetical protein
MLGVPPDFEEASMQRALQLRYEPDDAAPAEEYVRCGTTFQPSWQPTVWCACDRPRGHTGDHHGVVRTGTWSDLVRIG